MIAVRMRRLLVTATTVGLTSLAITAPTAATTDHDTLADERRLANAWVPAQQTLQFGAEPLGYAQEAATEAAAAASCAITNDEAIALVIAVTWPEVAPAGAPPSPMTLSRWDTQPTLADPENRAPGLWFHPGIGMWQLDSAGLGTDFTAAEAMDSQYAAERMAPFMVNKYCTAVNGGVGPAAARASAWTDWVACHQGACEDTYHRALQGVTPVEGIDRLGGAEERTCLYQGAEHDCVFVDPDNAQGADWWTAPEGGPAPVAAPFYVLRLDTGTAPTELRYWLAEDSGAATDVAANRPFGVNARDGLSWSTGLGLCDLTAERGDC